MPGPGHSSKKFQSVVPKCSLAGTEAEEKNLLFIINDFGEAFGLSQESGVNVTWLLGWAAAEARSAVDEGS
jgi:hypothetical protein